MKRTAEMWLQTFGIGGLLYNRLASVGNGLIGQIEESARKMESTERVYCTLFLT